jgi:hypothetical protein
MHWTVADYAHANHSPVVDVNGHSGTEPISIDAEAGQPVVLDASRSRDPDGGKLHFTWFHYPEAGAADGTLAAVAISGADRAKAVVTPTAVCRPLWLPIPAPCPSGTAHIILTVTDDGSPSLTSYRRIIVHVVPAVVH